MTGMDLRLLRISKRVTVTSLATAMGVNHSRVSQIEAQAKVTDKTTTRYLNALYSLEAAVA